MRGRAFLLFGSLCGCGVLSGLDGLDVVDDASTSDANAVDASAEAADATTGVDASDAGSDAGPVPPADASVIHCGPTTVCTGQTCCVSATDPYTYTCINKDCGGGAVALYCDDKSDCPNTGQNCCFSGNLAQCTISSSCASRLCSSAQQCGNNAQCVPFDAGYGLSLSRCQ